MIAKRVLIVDDHAIVRAGLKRLLEGARSRYEIGEAANAATAIRALDSAPWDLLLLDINLPDRSGLDVLKHARQHHPMLPVLVLSMHSEDQYAVRALRGGAAGYVTKESAPDELLTAVDKVVAGGRYITPAVAESLAGALSVDAAQPAYAQLSDREFEVLRLIASGRTATEIAETLCLSVKTISTYRTRLLKKLNLKNNGELTRYAFEHRIVS